MDSREALLQEVLPESRHLPSVLQLRVVSWEMEKRVKMATYPLWSFDVHLLHMYLKKWLLPFFPLNVDILSDLLLMATKKMEVMVSGFGD